MKKQDFKEFTVDARVAGPTREVQFTTGDVMVTSPALIIKGVTAAEAWQILLILDQGLFSKEELEADAKASAAPPEPPPAEEPPKKKRKTKAQKKAEEKAAAAAAEEEEPEEEEPDEPAAEEEDEEDEPTEEEDPNPKKASAQAKLDAERLKTKAAVEKKMEETAAKKEAAIAKADAKKKTKTKKSEVGGIDLEQFKSASGLRELVGDFKEAGVDDKDDVITYCTELQGMGLKCLKGVNIERRVANLWAMVA